MKDDSFDCTLIAHLRIFLLFYRLLYCPILPENLLFFGIWKVVEIEHELGLSVDINAESSGASQDAVYEWLDENAYKYGFIKRYPADKTDITGIDNEPWHYRYVGYEAAKEMKEQNLCLEEYLKKGKSSED